MSRETIETKRRGAPLRSLVPVQRTCSPEHCLVNGGFPLYSGFEKSHVSDGQSVSFKEPCSCIKKNPSSRHLKPLILRLSLYCTHHPQLVSGQVWTFGPSGISKSHGTGVQRPQLNERSRTGLCYINNMHLFTHGQLCLVWILFRAIKLHSVLYSELMLTACRCMHAYYM